ncbi:MAG: hypothetical protein R6T99_07600 [Bacteroidales bacterium]
MTAAGDMNAKNETRINIKGKKNNCMKPAGIMQLPLFLLVSVFSQAFFTLVRRHLMSFPFFPAWHDSQV